MDRKNQKSSSGFTMMELIIVIVLLVILAGLMVPRYPGSMLTLNAQTQALMGDLRYIQSLAETHGQRYCFKQNTTKTYSLYSTNGVVDTLITHPATGKSTTPLVTFSDTSITFGAFTNLPNNVLIFDGKGIPYSDSTSSNCFGAGVAATTNNATIPLTAGGRTCTITIVAETGMGSIVCT